VQAEGQHVRICQTEEAGLNVAPPQRRFADLTGADLDANLSGANLSDANLRGTNLSNADLRAAENLTQGQLDKACGNADTKLPEGLTLKDTCKE
jgi:uncharacterized protein YjbI with pentapeptide repeats